jgi:hypothetical protein
VFAISGLVTASTEPSLPVGVQYFTGTVVTDGLCLVCDFQHGLESIDFTMYWGTEYNNDSFLHGMQTGSFQSFSPFPPLILRLVLFDYAQFFGDTFVDECHAGDCGHASGTISVSQVTPEPAAWFLLATVATLSYATARRHRLR